VSNRFQDRHALVTGAGSGIGRAIACRLASEGASVTVVDINADGGQGTAELVADAGGRANFVRGDVSAEEDVALALAQAIDWAGPPTVLVNSAGIIRQSPALATSPETFDLVIATNLRSVFLVSTAVARVMVAHGLKGRIINISSIHAVVSGPNACAYTAAKGGIEAFSRTLATELAPHGITVNCVRPGATWTALNTPYYRSEVVEALNNRIPLGVIANPEDIAAGVCYLASDEAWYTTGTNLDIDGGYIMDGSLPGTSYT
jgi:Dehydrogenases with different specificities (related to short-chain alcohol dehydrogenases)